VFTGTAQEAAFGASLRAQRADHDALGRGDLRAFATLLQEAALVVSVDTGVSPVAGLFETATVIIPSGRQPVAL
jgi:ADP-heptose:LPS heptosyltransferase